MNVRRFDLITTADTDSTLCTVPANKAFTVTGFTIVQTEGNNGQITIKVGNNQVIGQFGISGPDTIYPIANVNMAATESLNVNCSCSGVFITASVIERDV